MKLLKEVKGKKRINCPEGEEQMGKPEKRNSGPGRRTVPDDEQAGKGNEAREREPVGKKKGQTREKQDKRRKNSAK